MSAEKKGGIDCRYSRRRAALPTSMNIEEKIGTTFGELGVTDAQGVVHLFEEVQKLLEEDIADHQRWAAQPPDALRLRWLGRKNSILARIDEHWLKAAPKDLKSVVGREFNNVKKKANATLELSLEGYGIHNVALKREEKPAGSIDLTLPGLRRPLGSIHPVTRVQREIEEIFIGLGFKIETGPEIESVYYNFDALNIPETHPSRDDWDTIYVDAKTLLRTHTSPVQIRAMEKYVKAGSQGGLYIITPGKCYRNDNPDATHSPMFHQMEGLAIDTDITFADLKGTLDYFAKKFFGEKTRTSFTPTFFPFTEPSGEVAVTCYVCGGAGCRTCKESGWIELMGCGMIHPKVLENGGIDPARFSGWAFGLGIDRFAMARYGINDIQLFFQGDVRFLEQF